MDPATLADVLILFALLSVSAVLAAGECAFFRVRLDSLRPAGDRRGAALLGMLAKPHHLLLGLVIATSLCHAAIALLALRIAWRAFPAAGRTAASAVFLLLAALVVAIFARLLPRIYVGRSPKAAALNLARPVAALLVPVYPLVKIVLVFTRELLESWVFQVTGDHSVLVGGAARVADLNQALGTCIGEGRDCDTIAQLVSSLAGGVPSEGQEFAAGGLRLVAGKVRRGRIERVLIEGTGIGKAAREAEE